MTDISPPDAPEVPDGPPPTPGVPAGGPPLVEPPPLPESAPPRTTPGPIELVIGVALLWGAEVALGIMLVAYMALTRGGAAFDPTDPQLALPPEGLLFTTVVSFFWILAVSWYLTCRRYRRSFREGFTLAPVGRRTLALGIGLGVAGAFLAALLLTLFGTGKSMMSDLGSTPLGLTAIFVLMLLAPFFEEIYYRGFIFPVLRRSTGVMPAIAITSLWFGAAHVMQLFEEPVAIPIILTMGAIWTVLRHRTESLWPAIASHFSYNFTLFLITAVEMLWISD